MERVSQRLGRIILGDTPVSPMQVATGAGQESAGASAGMGERPAPQPAEHGPRGFGPQVYEGVPVAERPRHKQLGCETCCQSFEPQRRVKCHVCCLWIHDECVETLHIGSKWNAEMCLACQQRLTRRLRVISAIELKKGHHWNQDQWYKDLQSYVRVGTGFGVI